MFTVLAVEHAETPGLMRAPGFDTIGAIRLLERLRKLDRGVDSLGVGPYLSTHPPVEERLRQLRRLALVSE
jgi:predicted Zn-dependent protease